MRREVDPLEAEGQSLQAEMDRAVRRASSLGRSLTSREEQELFDTTAGLRQRIADWTARKMFERRPEVRSHGTPVAGAAAKRGLEEARARLRQSEGFKKRQRCPAADVLTEDPDRFALRCGVEGTVLSAAGDPMSVHTFCVGDHTRCPSWRAEREANWAGRKLEVA